jgi:uncharacterized protein YecE (DUF72 family)
VSSRFLFFLPVGFAFELSRLCRYPSIRTLCWLGTFFSEGLPEREYLTYYATKFETVKVDSTFYRTPSPQTVKGWDAKTPPGFLFAAKVPPVVTHEKVLVDCETEFKQLVDAMDTLGYKLGPLLLQFGYFNRKAFASVNDFLARIRPFLKNLSMGHRFALEIRNRNWLVPQFVETLREWGAALALIDQSWMPRAAEWFEKFDPITVDFTYVRWLGERLPMNILSKAGKPAQRSTCR